MNRSLAPSAPTPAAETRIRQIIEAAAKVLGRQGYAATSTKDIAQEAGIAQGLIHYYFRSKDDLVLAVLKQHCDQMIDESHRAFAESEGSPLARAWATLEAARERTAGKPEMFKLFYELLPLSFTNPAIQRELEATYDHLTAVTLEMIEELNTELPRPLPVPPADFASVIVASIDGVALRSLVDPKANIDALFRGLSFVLLCTIVASYAAAGQAVPTDVVLQQLLSGMPVGGADA